MKRVLLTGFEPFDGDTINPSWEVARTLGSETLDIAHITALRLPCVFGDAREMLWRALETGRYDLLLCLGLAGSRTEVTVERIAINVDDARIPDNAGQQPVDVPVVAGAPAAYWASVPIKRMVAAVRAAGVPASVSQTAGTFVCNHVFYAAAHWRATRQPALGVGFLHLPLLTSQAVTRPDAPGMDLPTQVQAVRCALNAALHFGADDLRQTGGAID